MAERLEDTDTTRIVVVRLSAPTHKALRIRVAEEDTSMQKWVEELIEKELGLREPVSKPKRVGRN